MYVIKLIVRKAFRSVVDHKSTYSEGDSLETQDIKRVNDLVKRGFAEIASIEEAKEEGGAGNGNDGEDKDPDKVSFRDAQYGVLEVKNALIAIGVAVAPNSGVKGLTKKVDELSEEQADALAEELSVTE